MTGSTLTALAANPAIFYRPIQLFVPLRFAIIFYSKILFIESTPTPPCSQLFRHPFFEPTPQLEEGRVRGVVDPFA
jgi:hypothetical protein